MILFMDLYFYSRNIWKVGPFPFNKSRPIEFDMRIKYNNLHAPFEKENMWWSGKYLQIIDPMKLRIQTAYNDQLTTLWKKITEKRIPKSWTIPSMTKQHERPNQCMNNAVFIRNETWLSSNLLYHLSLPLPPQKNHQKRRTVALLTSHD